MFLEILSTLFVGYLTYLVYLVVRVLRARKKLQWLPQAPRIPVLGSILEFGDHTRTINDIARLTDNPEKLSYLEVACFWGIIVKDYDLMEFFLSSNVVLDKDWKYSFLHSWLGTGLLTASGLKWKKRRRIITPAFHFSILEQFVEVFESNENIMIEKLYKEALEKDVDIYKYLTACTLDIISETAMGISVDSQKGKNQEYVLAVKDMLRIVLTRAFSAWRIFDFLFWFTQDYRKQNKNLKILHNFTNTVIKRRIEQIQTKKIDVENKTDDLGRKKKMAFLDLLLNSTVDGLPLTQEDIREEVDTFMFEGHDTTSTATSFILHMLTNHPEVQTKAREEQKQIFGNDRDRPVTYQDLQDMKYLEMVIKETLRLYPAVPFIGRMVTQDIEYKGKIIPKGSIITLFIYGINRDPDYHDSPEEFRPERFLDMSTKTPFAYIPFSAGPRNCIGQKFAMLEMKSIVSKILRNFELHPTNPPHQIKLSSEAVLKALNGVHLVLKKCVW